MQTKILKSELPVYVDKMKDSILALQENPQYLKVQFYHWQESYPPLF